MPSELSEAADETAGLVDGEYRSDRGVSWLERLTRRVVGESAPAGATVVAATTTRRARWHVSVVVDDQPLALIDVHVAVFTGGPDASSAANSELDNVLVKAVEQWRSVTRVGQVGDVRPWLGCVRIEERLFADETSDRAMESLNQLVNERNLDAACFVVIDPKTRSMSYPNHTMSLQAFRASLIGRCRYWDVARPVSEAE